MTDEVRFRGVVNESLSAGLSEPFYRSLADAKSQNDFDAAVRRYTTLLRSLQRQHESRQMDRATIQAEIDLMEADVSGLRADSAKATVELDALKEKYHEEEKILNIARSYFEKSEAINVNGEKVRIKLNQTVSELDKEKVALEAEILSLEDELSSSERELRRRRKLSRRLYTVFSEIKSKLTLSREEREAIFGADYDSSSDAEDIDMDDDDAELGEILDNENGDSRKGLTNMDAGHENVDNDAILEEASPEAGDAVLGEDSEDGQAGNQMEDSDDVSA